MSKEKEKLNSIFASPHPDLAAKREEAIAGLMKNGVVYEGHVSEVPTHKMTTVGHVGTDGNFHKVLPAEERQKAQDSAKVQTGVQQQDALSTQQTRQTSQGLQQPQSNERTETTSDTQHANQGQQARDASERFGGSQRQQSEPIQGQQQGREQEQ